MRMRTFIDHRERDSRIATANQLIETIASYGRRFLRHPDGRVAFFHRNGSRLWYRTQYGREVYCSCSQQQFNENGKFSDGGTLRALIWALRMYIYTGEPLLRGYFYHPSWYSDGDPWGYGDAMEIVRQKALELGILQAPTEATHGE